MMPNTKATGLDPFELSMNMQRLGVAACEADELARMVSAGQVENTQASVDNIPKHLHKARAALASLVLMAHGKRTPDPRLKQPNWRHDGAIYPVQKQFNEWLAEHQPEVLARLQTMKAFEALNYLQELTGYSLPVIKNNFEFAVNGFFIFLKERHRLAQESAGGVPHD